MNEENKTIAPTTCNGESPDTTDRMTFTGWVPDPTSNAPVCDLGNGLLLVIDVKRELTHAKASWLLQLPELRIGDASLDRPLRDDHVTRLLRHAQRGTFHPEWGQVITCICDEKVGDNPPGTEYRMDGQHRAWMRLYMPEDWKYNTRWLKYHAKSLEDLRLLYASIDRGAPRTPSNVINAHLAGTDQFEGCHTWLIRLLAGAMHVWLWEDIHVRKQHDADEVAYLMQTDHADIVNAVKDYLLGCPKGTMFEKTIRRVPVVAAMYETFRVTGVDHRLFWDCVRDGLGEEVKGLKDPRIKLHNGLRESVVGQGSDTGRTNKRDGNGRTTIVPSEGMYRWCVNCWNLWRKGETISQLKMPETRPMAK